VKWGVVVFPGSNDDRDTLYALESALGFDVEPLWHADEDVKGVDAIALPGGFSYGDYLRCGALARFSPIMRAVAGFADAGGPVLGICNGFQILCEAGLLPGALVRNRDLKFLCRTEALTVEAPDTAFSSKFEQGERIVIPVKHGEGCYAADADTLAELENEGRVVFRYAGGAPNGSLNDIAGIANAERNVVGLMPQAKWRRKSKSMSLSRSNTVSRSKSMPAFASTSGALRHSKNSACSP
jgi:phosphoribosylformylglycinamidine synthase